MSPSISVRLLLTQSDARLLALAGDGHERAFEALVQRYRRPLLRYCRRLLLPDERAEDALQQALMQAWIALRNGVEVNDARSWLFRIVHNSALNALRVSGYDYCTLTESLCGADAPQADLDRRIAVREALAGLVALPQMQREALLRTAVEGASHAQAARDLGITETALRGLVYRARTTLRAAVTAVTPPPLVAFAVGTGARSTPVVETLAGTGAGGGSAGLAGLLLKGGVVAMTAGTLATGIGFTHRHRNSAKTKSRSNDTELLATTALADDTTQLSRDRSVRPVRRESVTHVMTGSSPRGPSTSSGPFNVRQISRREARDVHASPTLIPSQPTRSVEPDRTPRMARNSDGESGFASMESQPSSNAPTSTTSDGSAGSSDGSPTRNEDVESKESTSSPIDKSEGDRNSTDLPSGPTETGPDSGPEGTSDKSWTDSYSQNGEFQGQPVE